MAPRRRARTTPRRNPPIRGNLLEARGKSGFRRLEQPKSGPYGGWLDVPDRIRNKMNVAARQAAVAVMNDLAEKGPAYSGEFRDNWRALAIGDSAGGGGAGAYPYQISDVPNLKITRKSVERVKVFEIINVSPYALYAMDIIPGKWITPEGVTPKGGVEFGVLYGKRYGRFRGEVEKDPEARRVSTAEKDWYTNYVNGGAMSDQVKRVLRISIQSSQEGNFSVS